MKKYLQNILKLPFPLKWFLVTEGLFGLGIGIWNVNLNLHLSSMGMSDMLIGSLLAANTVVSAGLSVFMGDLSDRIGFHPAMVYGCLLKGIGMILVAVSGSFLGFLTGLVVAAIGDSLVLSSEFPFLFSFAETEHQSLVYSLLIAVFMLAMVIGNALGGFLAEAQLMPSNPYLIPITISGILFIFLGLGRRVLPRRKVGIKGQRRFFYHLLSENRIRWFLLYSLTGGIVFNLVFSMMNIVIRNRFGLTDSQIGLAFSCATLMGFISGLAAPLLIKRYNSERVAIIALFSYALLIMGMGIAGFAMFMAFWIGYTFLRLIVPPAVDSPILGSIPEAEQGSFSGLRIFAVNIGSSIGSYAAGVLVDLGRYELLMLAAGGLVLVQLGIYYFRCRYLLRNI